MKSTSTVFRRSWVATLFFLLPLASSAQTPGFTGVFDPANWTFTSGGAPASVTWNETFTSFTLAGSNDESNSATYTLFTINLTDAYRVSFDWSYSTADAPNYDQAGYVAGSDHQLSDNSGSAAQSGSTTLPVYFSAGDSGFYIFSMDNGYGAAALVISNFSYTLATSGDTGDGGGGTSGPLDIFGGTTVNFSAVSETASWLTIDESSTLNLRNGATLALSDSSSIYIDNGSHLSLSGTGTALTTPGGMLIGAAGTATVDVLDGASLGVGGSVDLGGSSGDGRITVSGAGSRLDITGILSIGSYAYGALDIIDGGTVTTGSTVVGDTGAGRGDLLVSGENSSLTVNGNLEVGTNPLHSTFTVTDGADANISGTFKVYGIGEAFIGTGGPAGHLSAGTVEVWSKLTFNHTDTLVFSSPLSLFGGTLVKAGSGTLILTGAMSNNSTDNTIKLEGGTLQIGNGGTTGSLADNVISSTGTALVFNRSNNLTYSFNLSGAASLTQAGTGTLTLSGDNTHTGGTIVSTGTLRATTVASALGAGPLTLSGGNLELGNNSGLNFGRATTISANTTITSDRRSTNGAGVNHTLGTLSIGAQTLTVAAGSRVNSGTAGITFGTTTLTGNATFNVGSNTRLTLGAVGETGGSRGFTKSGSGNLTLSGPNTYTGLTAINAGTLALASGTSLANSSAIQVGSGATFDVSALSGGFTFASGQTLGGSGSVTGLVTFASGSHLAPGSSPGTLTFTGGLALNTGAFLDFELGTASDKIRVSGGTLTGPGSGKLTVNLFDSGGFTAGTYTLIDATGATLTSIGATNFELGTVIAGYNFSFSQSGNLLQLTASAVPEPAAFAALAGAVTLALAAVRRRTRVTPDTN